MTRWTVAIISVDGALVVWGAGACERHPRARRHPDNRGLFCCSRCLSTRPSFLRFARHWERKTGRKVRFEESYSGSGAQARAIASGFDADVAVLSLEGDIDKLVKAGLVRKDWKAGPNRGMITRSLVVIGYRPGNPKKIHDWEDLTRPGIGVVYPDPKTSGGARWNINAIYGVGLFRDRPLDNPIAKRPATCLRGCRPMSSRWTLPAAKAWPRFDRGTGDAIVTYENELLLQGKLDGRTPPYAIPPATLLIEGPAADRGRIGQAARKSGARRGVSGLPPIGRGPAHPVELWLPTARPGPRHRFRPRHPCLRDCSR